MNYLLYQAYGKQDIINEAILSILSLVRLVPVLPHGFSIVVYTDNSSAFEKILGHSLPVLYVKINDRQVSEWRGKIDFVHRVKIEILRDFLSMHKGNLLYLDSDTWFLENPFSLFDLIGEGRLLMHTCEGRIDSGKNPIFKKVQRFISANIFEVAGEKLKIPPASYMWNAGVIGFNSGKIEILEKVLQLTDEMYARYPKHVMEQFAFSWYFQNGQSIVAAENTIYHYWDFKEYRQHIAGFLEENKGRKINELAVLSENIAPYKVKPAAPERNSFSAKLKFLFKSK